MKQEKLDAVKLGYNELDWTMNICRETGKNRWIFRFSDDDVAHTHWLAPVLYPSLQGGEETSHQWSSVGFTLSLRQVKKR